MPPLHPPPAIDDRLCLVTQPLRHATVGRDAMVTFALHAAAGEVGQDLAADFQANWNTNIAPALDNNVLSLPPTVRVGDGTHVPAIAGGVAGAPAGAVARPPWLGPSRVLTGRRRSPCSSRRTPAWAARRTGAARTSPGP